MFGELRQRLIVGLSLLAGAIAIAVYTDFRIFYALKWGDSAQTVAVIYLAVLALGVVVSLTMRSMSYLGLAAIFLCQGLAEFKAVQLLTASIVNSKIMALNVADLLGMGFVLLCVALAVIVGGDRTSVYRINGLFLAALLPLAFQDLGFPSISI